MESKKLSDRFKQIRKELGLTQEELAEKLNYEINTIKSIECRRRRITEDVANEMFNRFSINPQFLLDEKDNRMILKGEDFIKDLESISNDLAVENSLMLNSLINFAILNNYEYKLNNPHEFNNMWEYFSKRKEFLILSKDNKEIILSDKDVIEIGNVLDKKFQSLMNKAIKEK